MAKTASELKAAEESLRIFRENNLTYHSSTDPALLMEHARLLRDVKLKSEVYLSLSQQRELSDLEKQGLINGAGRIIFDQSLSVQ